MLMSDRQLKKFTPGMCSGRSPDMLMVALSSATNNPVTWWLLVQLSRKVRRLTRLSPCRATVAALLLLCGVHW